MKRTVRMLSVSLLGLVLATAMPAYGDIARPSPSQEKSKVVLRTSLTVVPDSKANVARLQLSQESLRELRAALADVPGNESMTQRVAHSPTRTMVAGLFLFLSLSFTGVWLARSVKDRSKKVVAAFVIGVGVVGATAIVSFANAGPPPAYFWRKLPDNLTHGRSTNGSVSVEILAEGSDSGIRLIVPLTPER